MKSFAVRPIMLAKEFFMHWKVFSKLVMLPQTLFGLPWTLTGAVLPFLNRELSQSLSWGSGMLWLGIFLAFFFARTAGMAFNRLIDRHIDAANPRTSERLLPTGEVTPWQVAGLAWGSSLLFVGACALINKTCFVLSPLAVFLLWAYSFTKRYTALCHFVLGLIHFLGPIFAWVAVTNQWGMVPFLLGCAVLTSIAANDIVYSIQDVTFDRGYGLHSIPATLGPKPSLVLARLLHVATVLLLVQIGIFSTANIVYYLGVALIAIIYCYHHYSLNPKDSQLLNQAFSACNSLVGTTLLLFTLGAVAWNA